MATPSPTRIRDHFLAEYNLERLAQDQMLYTGILLIVLWKTSGNVLWGRGP